MPQTSPYAAVLTELEPVVAENLDRHIRMAKEWHPARLRAVGRGPQLRLPGRGGLVARAVAARRDGEGRDVRQPAHRGQPAQLPPGDRHPVRPGRRLGHSGSAAGRRRRAGTASRCATTSSSPAASTRSSSSGPGWTT